MCVCLSRPRSPPAASAPPSSGAGCPPFPAGKCPFAPPTPGRLPSHAAARAGVVAPSLLLSLPPSLPPLVTASMPAAAPLPPSRLALCLCRSLSLPVGRPRDGPDCTADSLLGLCLLRRAAGAGLSTLPPRPGRRLTPPPSAGTASAFLLRPPVPLLPWLLCPLLLSKLCPSVLLPTGGLPVTSSVSVGAVPLSSHCTGTSSLLRSFPCLAGLTPHLPPFRLARCLSAAFLAGAVPPSGPLPSCFWRCRCGLAAVPLLACLIEPCATL